MMVLLLLPCLIGFVQPAPAAATAPIPSPTQSWRFESQDEILGWSVDVTGDAKRRMPQPKVENGMLTLLESWSRSSAAISLPFESEEVPTSFEVSWTIVMNTGTEGMGLAWMDLIGGAGVPAPMRPEESRDPGGNAMIDRPVWGWEAPNLRRGFGVGFDASNPVNRDPFRGSGNAMDRPQHEVSLHWDGMEIVKKASVSEFRDEKPHRVSVVGEFVTGGALVWVKLDEEVLFDRYFIAGMTAFAGRAVFGASNGETAGDVRIDDVEIATKGVGRHAEPPTSVLVFDRVVNDKDHGENKVEASLPEDLMGVGRIIATLRLDKPESRFDPWDRTAHVFIEDVATGERMELIRYITPYHRGYEWKMDVSEFRPLLSGKKRFVQVCGTYGEGWVVSLRLDYYKGTSEGGLIAERIENLWCGAPTIGDPDHPPGEFYTSKEFTLEPWVKAVTVRTVVSGHGMSPNTGNAAEFMSIDRTLTINGLAFTNTLWKTDNYLNPCRPQGGTWKYDRAGWAPGDIVRPWLIDATSLIGEARTLVIGYDLAPYENKERGKASAPSHVTQSQLILYKADVTR